MVATSFALDKTLTFCFERQVTPGPVITSRNCLPPWETIRTATLVLSYRQGSVGLSLRLHHILFQEDRHSPLAPSGRCNHFVLSNQHHAFIISIRQGVMLPCPNNKVSLPGASDKSPSSGQIDTILSSCRNWKVMVASPDVKAPVPNVNNKHCSTFIQTSYRRFSGTFTASGPRLWSEQHACRVLSLGLN